ncbi:MAG: hypothetical protein J6X24_08715, partial [Firmicutes bacterium]|nr:hypothetical protein [Bacillota bacterium]
MKREKLLRARLVDDERVDLPRAQQEQEIALLVRVERDRLRQLRVEFGSGKSELALNLALEKAKDGPCTLVDLDVINPYFRTSERGDVLVPAGVELIMPPFALDKIEIMSLSAKVFSAFSPGEGNVIFDIGGDDVGSIALGQYKARFDQIPPDHLNVLFVVNP